MSTTREVEFLNSLLTDDDGSPDQARNRCPDATILWSLTQKNQAGSDLVSELKDHIAICPSCRDLARRLQSFHQSIEVGETPQQEEQWAQAAPRLEERVQALVQGQTQQGQTQQGQTPKEPRRGKLLQFSKLRLALPLALAGCAAGVALFAVLDRHDARILQPRQDNQTTAQLHGNGVAGTPLVALAKRGDSGAPQSPPLRMDQRAGSEPQILAFTSGQHLKLQLIAVRLQPDGNYQFTGRLLSDATGEAIDNSTVVTGNWINSDSQDHPSVSIEKVVEGSTSYLSSIGGSSSRVATVQSKEDRGSPFVGETIELEVMHGGTLDKARP